MPDPSNVTADSLSRKHLSDHEWQLSKTIFQTIANQFPTFSIDLFASMLNTQLDRFASWDPDPHASIIDAFSVSWGNEYFYALPPFSLIPKCLRKISSDLAEGVLVVPAWCPILLQMLSQPPKLLIWSPPQMELLTHPLDKVHRREKQAKTDCLSSVRQQYENQGLSEHVTNVLLN